jgi:hypothetical protein
MNRFTSVLTVLPVLLSVLPGSGCDQKESRRYQGKMLGEWIVDLAKEMGLRGATLSTG